MIGHVYIEGQIGSTRDENGKVTLRGVELQDVISQFQLNKGSELVHVHINSPGGDVETGRKISEYLQSFNNVVTIAEILCASIATEIHLSVPKERRKIAAGTDYHIHQPMISLQRGVALNQTQLDELSDDIAKTEKEMVAMYCKATGLDKTAISLLMKQATSLTPEQCVEYGFVSEIIASEFKAVAFITPKKSNQNNETMSELKEDIKNIKESVASIIAKITGGKQTKKIALKTTQIALDLKTTEGVDVVVVTEMDVPSVGDMVTLPDGSAVEDGTYQFPQGQLVVVDGKVTEILPPATEEVVVDEAAFKALQEKYDALLAERTEEKAELESLKTDVLAMAKLTSDYKPKTRIVAFRKDKEDKEKDKTGEGIRAIREKRNKK